MKFIDLSVTINEQTPVYPGDPTTKIKPEGTLEKDGAEDHYLCIGTHAGTHVDAPRHMIEGAAGLDQIPIENFSGQGVYIRAEKGFDLDTIKSVQIQEGDIVLFHTGMSDAYHKPEYYDTYPAISEDIANYLVSKKIKMVGVDMCSVDREPFPIHKILLGNNILIIENLTNLSILARETFKVYAFPLKLQLDGSPTRVVAELL